MIMGNARQAGARRNSGPGTSLRLRETVARILAQASLPPGQALSIADKGDRQAIISLIDAVAAERRYFRTARYRPDAQWELLLRRGLCRRAGMLVVLKEGGAIVGYARLSALPFRGGRRASIGLALLPAYRARGIGSIMLKKILDCAGEFGFLSVEADVLAGNIVSQRLFRKAGFSELGRRELRSPWTGELLVECILVRPLGGEV